MVFSEHGAGVVHHRRRDGGRSEDGGHVVEGGSSLDVHQGGVHSDNLIVLLRGVESGEWGGANTFLFDGYE